MVWDWADQPTHCPESDHEREEVTTHWIYGWGIRWIPGGWLWNVSGLDGVELALVSGRRFRIGTDEPEQLAGRFRKCSEGDDELR